LAAKVLLKDRVYSLRKVQRDVVGGSKFSYVG